MPKRVAIVIFFFMFSPSLLAENCEYKIESADQFYRCALLKDKRVTSLSVRGGEREGRRAEAAQVPNPEVETELTFSSESSQNISIVQPIDIGGKRSARIKIAEAENRASSIEDESILAEVATDVAVSLVRYRQLNTRASLFREMKNSLWALTKRLKEKAVRTPEEKTAVMIFSMQNTVLETQLLSLRQELKLVKNSLETSIGRKLKKNEKLLSNERKEWPRLDENSIKETFETKLAVASLDRVRGEVERQKSLAWPELAIGPLMEKQDGSEASWGAKVEFVIPLFNTNGGGRQKSRAEFSRAQALFSRTKFKESSRVKVFFEQYHEVAKFLKNSPSQKSIKKSISKSLKLFSRGMIQPAAIAESYRSTLETLEAVQEKELVVYQLYWMLRAFSGEVPKEFL